MADTQKGGEVNPVNPGKVSTSKDKKNQKDQIIINPTVKQDGALNERFLNVVQRLRAGQQMRRRESILKLKKSIARFRPHTKAQLKTKASQLAKQAARARFAGERGRHYEKLSAADKMRVDAPLESKVGLIKRMAQRLMPRLASADVSRLSDVRKHKAVKGIQSYMRGTPLNQSFDLEAVSKIYDHLTEKDIRSLEKKSTQSGISFETIKEIFARGLNESTKQRAFERVNSFIAGGKAATLDQDLLGELKQSTVTSYQQKAAQDVKDLKPFTKKGQSSIAQRIIDRRKRGLEMAKTRMEEVEVEEGYKRVKAPSKFSNYLQNRIPDPHRGQPAGEPMTKQEIEKRTQSISDLADKMRKANDDRMKKEDVELDEAKKKMSGEDPCWDGYHMVGTKKKGGKEVPNCVPKNEEVVNEINVMNRTSPVRRSNYTHPDQTKTPGEDGGTHHVVDEKDNVVATYKNKMDAIAHAAKKSDLKVKSVYKEEKTPAWSRKEGKNPEGGLNRKGIASYRRENPGSKLSMAVTTPPSKLDPDSKAAKRRKSFCARMGGVDGPMKKPNGEPTRKALALRKWNC